MKTTLTILILFFWFCGYGQEPEYYFVNAESGLNVRADSDLSSKKVAKIPFGVLVEKVVDTDEELTVNDAGKKINGKWVKIKYDNYVYLVSNETEPFESEGYVFDGYLKRMENTNAVSAIKIDSAKYSQLLKKASKKTYKPKKIGNLDSIKTILKNRVEWMTKSDWDDDFLDVPKSITTANGQKLLVNRETYFDTEFAEGWSGYYPEEDILVLEGGHSVDVSFSIKTGGHYLTAGNPQYIVPSPKGTYRLNGLFSGQDCIDYFFEKRENGQYTYLAEFGDLYNACEFKEFYWLNENEFIYKKMDYSTDSKKEIEVFFKGHIKTLSLSKLSEDDIRALYEKGIEKATIFLQDQNDKRIKSFETYFEGGYEQEISTVDEIIEHKLENVKKIVRVDIWHCACQCTVESYYWLVTIEDDWIELPKIERNEQQTTWDHIFQEYSFKKENTIELIEFQEKATKYKPSGEFKVERTYQKKIREILWNGKRIQ